MDPLPNLFSLRIQNAVPQMFGDANIDMSYVFCCPSAVMSCACTCLPRAAACLSLGGAACVPDCNLRMISAAWPMGPSTLQSPVKRHPLSPLSQVLLGINQPPSASGCPVFCSDPLCYIHMFYVLLLSTALLSCAFAVLLPAALFSIGSLGAPLDARMEPTPAPLPAALEASSGLCFVSDVCGALKKLKRTGWVVSGVPLPESDADHMHRAAMCALLVGQPPDPRDDYEGPNARFHPDRVDCQRLLRMAVTHDLCEALAGDITPNCPAAVQASKHEKEGQAMAAIRAVVGDPLGAELYGLWAEYEAQEVCCVLRRLCPRPLPPLALPISQLLHGSGAIIVELRMAFS